MTDSFAVFGESLTTPASQCFVVTPNDTTELTLVTKALYVGVGGDVTLLPASGSTDVLFRNVPAGGILDVRVRAVRATGTTAAGLVGLA